MAKYRHRVFEMYEFRAEALRALTPPTAEPVQETSVLEPWTFNYLTASRFSGVMHVQFINMESFGDDASGDLRADFTKLANHLGPNTKVLLDFEGVTVFGAPCVNEIVLFNQTLRIKGSRIALCRLEPAVRESFFVTKK